MLAQLVQGIRVREEAGIQVREVRIDGTLSGSTSSSQVSLVSVDSITDADSSQYYAYDLLLEGTTGYYDWEISGTSDLDTGAFNETLDIAVGSDGVETRLDLDTEGEGENSLDGAGTLVHDGDKVADVTIRETRFTFTGPDGDGFTAQATFDLEQVTYSLMVEGAFVTIGLLPLLRQL
ncbi:MAG TPA: hypothetical protein VK966_07965 [Longimicrobiales bacterium]|nr:hypothetical protein [Longimicrobiales bacterium]